MKPNVAPDFSRLQLSEFIAQAMGLHFPPERYADLERGLAAAATELGFADANACANQLLSAPPTKAQLQVLAGHLTVGETYFFREQKTFDVLAATVLPELIRVRRAAGRRLRLWSAACCTGEEPYSLAILLRQVLPDLADWHVTILATDLNGRFLQTAAAGIYRDWSFRDSPPWLKDRYFRCLDDGRHEVLPEIRKQVTFAPLNLVEDVYPALATNTNAMDVIFCRNVLMYFTPAQAQKVMRNLRNALVDDGWLVVSPTDGSPALLSGFAPRNFPGVTLYQKGATKERTPPPSISQLTSQSLTSLPEQLLPAPAVMPSPQIETPPADAAVSLDQEGRHARALANQGKLAEALVWCDRWVAADKMNASAHYLRAVVLQELGDRGRARHSLQRAIYLHPDFVLAHFALGNLARHDGKNEETARHFSLVSRLLAECRSSDLLPESDGMTAGQLANMVNSINDLEEAR